MGQQSTALRHRILVGLALLLAIGAAAPLPAVADVAIILHPDNDAGDISIRHLRLLYSGYTRRWENGRSVDLVLPMGGSDSMELLATRVFKHMDEAAIHRFYLHAIFRERITKHPEKLGDRDAIRFVRQNPGAVALVDPDRIPQDSGVRIISLSDTKPEQ